MELGAMPDGPSWQGPPPDTPSEPTMEFLSRSWSASALHLSRALSAPAPRNLPEASPDIVLEHLGGDAEDVVVVTGGCGGNPFSFASSETSQMVMERILSQSQEVSPRTSGRLSHSSEPFNGTTQSCCSLTDSPPVSPSDEYSRPVNPPMTQFRASPAGTSLVAVGTVGGSKTVGRWLKDRRERRKEEMRAQNAQLHAAISVAGVAAAVAAMVAATAASSSAGKDEQVARTDRAVASAATLVAAQCVEAAESLGAEREQLAAVIGSAVNVRSAGDIMTLTASAATALRGVATLRARALKEVCNIAAVIPVEQGLGSSHGNNGSNSSSNSSNSGELGPDNFLGICSRELLARGCELLKRTRTGDLHWKIVSVYINRLNQVIIKTKSRHVAGTITKKKKNVVVGVIKDMPAWPGRHLLEGGEDRRYFGLKTVMRGVVEFECLNQREHDVWTGGVSRLLALAVERSTRHRI
ncbi:hypothetical protein MLD38_020472 [Melastoma candidum]|uniref:Uncharacterized protein n=1 Tax=Melastoma candidum TaxID=119954 RepID=A0ACB9QDJ3_9MYRT|nr:hypothetical protein MLD38_020472 [Melastoma candidum]